MAAVAAWLHAGPARVAFSDTAIAASALTAAYACLHAAQRAAPRTTVRLLGTGAAAWELGMVGWTVLQLGSGHALPHSAALSATFLLGGACGLAGLDAWLAGRAPFRAGLASGAASDGPAAAGSPAAPARR